MTSAAARNGAALDRSGSTAHRRPRPGPGSTRHRARRGLDDLTRPRAARPASCRCAAATAPARCRRARARGPGRTAARPAAAPETNCEDADASISHRAAGDRAGAAHGERQPAAAALVDLHAGLAQPATRAAIGRTRARRHRRRRPPRRPARPPAARSASPCRPARRRSSPRAAGPGATTIAAVVGDVGTQRAQRRRHQFGVTGPERVVQPRRVLGQRGQDQAAGWSRLRAGQRDPRPRRVRSRRRPARHVVQSAGSERRTRRNAVERFPGPGPLRARIERPLPRKT